MPNVSILINSIEAIVVEPGVTPNAVLGVEADPPFPVRGGRLYDDELTPAQAMALRMLSEAVGEEGALALIGADE